ncbi:hypothetical protein BOX15_Mlig028324g1 [Macrostomum lignano]|uniref:Ig-like domain-containing protein n=1 Tax=Macrostomum lignano TaxID=282301 RepID=A0A267GFR0_9PLAT|nr:hypothetical protein BOX15_Mlig028324g1 [Macrostomum lignano]
MPWVLLLLPLLLVSPSRQLELASPDQQQQQNPYQMCASEAANCTCSWQQFHNLSRHNNLRVLSCSNYQLLNHFSSVIRVADFRHNSVLSFDRLLRIIIYKEIFMLNAAHNDISDLQCTAFNRLHKVSWHSLEYLDLSNNIIRGIDRTYFDIFPNLTHLLLADNRIEQLPEGVFAQQTKLRQLTLSGNPLKTLETDPFKSGYPANLELLNLSRCDLTEAEPDFFASTFFLRTLDMSRNWLSHLPQTGYPSLKALNSLDLSDNRFESTPIRFLRTFRRLELLRLDDNRRIRRLARDDLAGVNASRIFMRQCGLRTINAMAVHGVPYLHELNLDDNRQLSFVHHRAFHDVVQLRRLSLVKCGLHSLPGELTGQVLNTVVDIRYNPLWCLCDNTWISNRLLPRPSKVTFADPDELFCTSYSVVTPSRGEPFTVIDRRRMLKANISRDTGCPPRIYHPLSNLTVELFQGDRVILECLTTGLPRPSVYWMFPDNDTHLESQQPQVTSLSPNRKRIHLADGLLDLRDARVSDSGRYTCNAFNSHGRRNVSYVLVVQSLLLQLVPVTAGTDRLTVTWRGADRLHAEYYLIGYREVDSYEVSPRRRLAFRSVYPIRHEWRAFTAHHLRPARYYQFCLVHRHARHLYDNGSSRMDIHLVEFPLVFNNGQCIIMRTKYSIERLYGHGIYRVAHHSTVYILFGMVFGVLFLCCMTALVYQRSCKKMRLNRKQYRYSTVGYRDGGNSLQMKVLLDGVSDTASPSRSALASTVAAAQSTTVAKEAVTTDVYGSSSNLLMHSETGSW